VRAPQQCHITVDTTLPPIPVDAAATLAAIVAVESTAQLCYIGASLSIILPGFGNITEYGASIGVLPFPADCTAADRAVYLTFVAAQAEKAGNGTLAHVKYHYMDPACSVQPQ
jgi:hypothetical protein